MFTAKRWFLKLKMPWNNLVIRTASPFITLRIRFASSQWLCIRRLLLFIFFVIPMASPCNHFESASLLLSDYAFADSYSLSFLLYPWLRHVITSNPLRFFSVIMHSPNTFSFFCKQKAESIWLIVHNKKTPLRVFII